MRFLSSPRSVVASYSSFMIYGPERRRAGREERAGCSALRRRHLPAPLELVVRGGGAGSCGFRRIRYSFFSWLFSFYISPSGRSFLTKSHTTNRDARWQEVLRRGSPLARDAAPEQEVRHSAWRLVADESGDLLRPALLWRRLGSAHVDRCADSACVMRGRSPPD